MAAVINDGVDTEDRRTLLRIYRPPPTGKPGIFLFTGAVPERTVNICDPAARHLVTATGNTVSAMTTVSPEISYSGD